MAGQAPEGSQFNARQYDYKMVPGFEKLSAIQQRGIVPFCKGLDVIQQAQSGTGKMVSFCSCFFQHLDELFECQDPALAQQLENVKHALGDYLGVKVHACFGGTSVHEDRKVLPAGVHVGVSNPDFVFDMLCRQFLRANNIQMPVLDEADELISRDFKDQMPVDWSTLPLDILGDIAIKLESCDDFIYFSAVCRSWNRSSSSVKNLWMATPVPWLLLAENTERDPNCPRNIFKLNNNKRYSLNLPEMYGARCWGSPYGWVAVAKRDLSIQLFNPITKANICFPSLQTIPCLPVDYPDDRWFDYYEWILVIFLQKLIVLKVSEGGGHHEFVIVLLSQFMKGPIFAKHGDQSWTTILIKEPKVNVSDVVAMDDLVFALYDNEGAIAYWSATEFGLGVVKPMVYSTGSPRICKLLRCKANSAYLVQSGSDLLMVIRINLGGENVDDSDDDDYFETTYGTVDFKLFKINPNDKKLENVEDLGDVALFVGQNSSMLVSSAHGKGLQSGCIYFTDDYSELWFFPNKRTMLAGHDMGVFDLGTNRVERFYEGNDTRSLFCSPTWFVPHF